MPAMSSRLATPTNSILGIEGRPGVIVATQESQRPLALVLKYIVPGFAGSHRNGVPRIGTLMGVYARARLVGIICIYHPYPIKGPSLVLAIGGMASAYDRQRRSGNHRS